MIPYILHISILVACSYIFYKLFLEGETFFQLNRWVLLSCVLLAFVLPFLEVPQEWSLRKANGFMIKTGLEKEKPISLENQKPKEQKEKKDAPETKHVHDHCAAHDAENVKKEPVTPVVITKSGNTMPIVEILMYVYLAGVAIFALNFLMQLFLLFYKMLTLPTVKDGEFRIVEIDKDKAPFSFWNRIFMNPSKYDWDTYDQILQHEKIHVSERHTLDIILAELLVVVQWFNPFAWLYRKAVENNLEYLTDYKMLTKGTDRQSYQMNLLKITVPDLPLNLTTNYNQSFLKKRISMMNTKKSSLSSGWKYFFLIPLIGLSIICLNAVKTVADEIDTRYDDQFEQRIGQEIEQAAEATIPTVTTSVENQITLSTIKEPKVNIAITDSDDLILSGKWKGSIQGNEVCLSFINGKESKRNNWRRTECIGKGEFSNIPTGSAANFELKREAGTLKLNGRFTDSKGEGTYTFTENTGFRSYLEQQGYDEISEEMMFHMLLSDINKNYLSEIKRLGFEVDDEDLEAMAHMGISLNYIKRTNKDLKSLGYSNIKIDDLIVLHIHDVNMEYIKEFRNMGLNNMTIQDIVQASIHEVTPAYFHSLKAVGLDDLVMEEMIQFAIHDIQAEDVQALKNVGFRDMTAEDIVHAAIHEVTPEYLKSFESVGLSNMSLEEITRFAIHDIKAEDVKALQSLGFRDMSPEDIVHAGIHDISPEYLKSFEAVGLNGLTMEEITQFAIHDIRAEDVKTLQNLGFRDMSPEDIIHSAIHDITPKYLKELEDAGLGDLSMEEVVQFVIHDVDAKDIQELKNLGLRNLSHEDIVHANIHDVNAEYIQSLHKLGFKDVPMDQLVQCRIHNVDADFIKEAQASGKTGLTLEDYIHLKIHGKDEHK